MTWRPIETAPPDGTEVLVWASRFRDDPATDWRWTIGKVLVGDDFHPALQGTWHGHWQTPIGLGWVRVRPTHWMPLPPPPEPAP